MSRLSGVSMKAIENTWERATGKIDKEVKDLGMKLEQFRPQLTNGRYGKFCARIVMIPANRTLERIYGYTFRGIVVATSDKSKYHAFLKLWIKWQKHTKPKISVSLANRLFAEMGTTRVL
jgi:hypothetical protein